MNKNDKRYLRTHGELRRRFEELMLEKDYDQITISELAARAGINRKTFYLHYSSLDDVVVELQDGIMAELSELGETGLAFDDASRSEEIIARFAAILSRNLPLHRRLFCSGSYRFVFERIRGAMMSKYAAALGGGQGDGAERLGVFLDFISYGTLFTFRDWLATGKPGDANPFARAVGCLVRGAVEEYFNASENLMDPSRQEPPSVPPYPSTWTYSPE